ncbi:hypothetical protein K493DRAFT_313183 [Basidiobolus meristosporus CBS 931.73]|uniref:SMP-LTD domain-containing protein n=1 Tax=Basidiobolus meristosporus CBS 931.73 TaxID=1314790 RepID=A0A1Y1YNP5_9FUNG|nr:hypothetical protein K493DRAFT_313183 [Basidiobolus meristosporus CBS 931.73]|eukprot:ORX99595.1 hypothetical protein K493DRAFT_313183 [Basidiobolus meristosporus CBS 931.73]
MRLLIDKVNLDEHHRETQWLNALLGRIFLGMYKTQAIKDFVVREILLKISKIKRPTFLKEFSVKDLLLGDSIPSVTHPKLIDLNAAGEMSAEFELHYGGGFGIEFNTEMTIALPPFVNSVIPLKLAVRVRKAEGRMQLRVKSPPTNRFWLGFKEDPHITLDIVPVISNRVIRSTFISNILEKQIRAVINEIMVLPNMDDTHFFLSEGLGGIFDSAGITKMQHEVALRTQSETGDNEDNATSLGEFKTPTKLFRFDQTGGGDNNEDHIDSEYLKEPNESSAVASQMPLEIPLLDPSVSSDDLIADSGLKPPPPSADLGKLKSTDDFTLEGGLPNVTAVTRGYAMAKNADLKDSSWWKTSKESKRNSLPSFTSTAYLEQLKELPLNEKLGKLKLLPSLMSFRSPGKGNKSPKDQSQSPTGDAKRSNQSGKPNPTTSYTNSPALSAITSIFTQSNNSANKDTKQKPTQNAEGSQAPASSEPDNHSVASVQSGKSFPSLFSHSPS